MGGDFENAFWESTHEWPLSLKRMLAVPLVFLMAGTGWYLGLSNPIPRSQLTHVSGAVTSFKLRPAVGPLAEPAKDGNNPQGLAPFLGVAGYPDEIRFSLHSDFRQLSASLHTGQNVDALIIPSSSKEDHPDLAELSSNGVILVSYEQYAHEFRSNKPWGIAAGVMFTIVGFYLMSLKLPPERAGG